MKLKLSQKTHAYKTLMILFECHKYFMNCCLKFFILMFLAAGFLLPAGGNSGVTVSSSACKQKIAELANAPRLPFSSLPERVVPITTLEELAQAMSQGVNLRPEQISLFSLYLQNFFWDSSFSGNYNLRHFFKILETHPQLSTPSVREQILEFSVKQTPQPQSLKDFLRTLRRKKRTRANLFQIEANLGYWRKILGMEEPQIPSHLKGEEKQALKQKSKEEFLAHLDTVIDQETRRTWAAERYSPHYRSQAIDLYKALEKERNRLLQEGQNIQYITHAMVDVIDTIGFGSRYYVNLLESKNPFDNIEGIRQVFAERNTVAFNDLNFEKHFEGLRQALNDTRAIEEATAQILQIQKDVENQPYVIKGKETFRLRALSLQESPFRGCLGGDCSTKEYFDLALDPNFIYFTLTDGQHRSSGQLTVVLGTAVNKKGEIVKTAFVDKIQNISNAQLLSVLEGIRLSLTELGYALGLPQQVGNSNGLSIEPVTRDYVDSEILPHLHTSLTGFEPHTHAYNFDTRYSKAYLKLDIWKFDGSIESTAIISSGEIHFPQKAPPNLSIKSVFAPILALQNSSKTEDQIQFLNNIVNIIKLPELGLSEQTAREYIWSRLQDSSLDFKLRKHALYALIEFEMEFSNNWDLESLSFVLKSFTENEQQLIIGEMSQWKESRRQYRRKFIDQIPEALVRADIQILKDVLETSLWKPLLNTQNTDGDTALIWAAREKNTNVVATLIAAGAHLNIQNNYGDTALIKAIYEGNTKVLDHLIVAGADLNLKNKYGNTVLMQAALTGKTKVAAALIAAGADLNIQDSNGETALILAVVHGHIDIAKALIVAGADVNIQDIGGHTVLMVAAYEGHTEVADALIEAKANLNLKNSVGYTALMFAVLGRETKMIKTLIDAGADLNIQNTDEQTALLFGISKGHTQEAIVLIEAKANLNIQDNNGETALMWASSFGQTKVIAALMDAKVDLNIQNRNGETVLMHAVREKNTELIEVFIAAGADLNIQNNNGFTALKIAQFLNYNEIAKRLASAGEQTNVIVEPIAAGG